jgi:hypothetical protein
MYRTRMVGGVYFKPWVGRDYGPESRWRLRVLIVAESHYEWLPERWRNGDLMPATTTQELVEEISLESYRHAHWTKIAIALTGENPWPRSVEGPMRDFGNRSLTITTFKKAWELTMGNARRQKCSAMRGKASLLSSRI